LNEAGLAGNRISSPTPVVLEEENLTPTEPSLSRLIDIGRSKLWSKFSVLFTGNEFVVPCS